MKKKSAPANHTTKKQKDNTGEAPALKAPSIKTKAPLTHLDKIFSARRTTH